MNRESFTVVGGSAVLYPYSLFVESNISNESMNFNAGVWKTNNNQ